MKKSIIQTIPRVVLAMFLASVGLTSASGQDGSRSSARGLWVGQVTLGEVNEVVDAVDENNEFVRKPPEQTTKTADAAHLRLIVHVNSAGQASLVNGVAVLNRTGDRNRPELALITDHALYADFPRQLAKRIASVAFEFGDQRAVNAVRAVIQAAATAAGQGGDVDTAISNAIAKSDVDAAYVGFLEGDFSALFTKIEAAAVTQSASNSTAAAVRTAILAVAEVGTAVNTAAPALQTNYAGLGVDAEFNFGDGRASAALERVIDAAAAATEQAKADGGDDAAVGAAVQAAIDKAAAEVADIDREYERFVAGGLFSDAVGAGIEAAVMAAATLNGGGLSLEDLSAATLDATNQNPKVSEARIFAVENVQETPPLSGKDMRGVDALSATTEAIATAVATIIHGGGGELAARRAGREAADAEMETFSPAPASASAPSTGYTQFIASDKFTDIGARLSPIVVAAADDADGTAAQKTEAAELAAVNALTTELGLASRVSQNELLMSEVEGGFGPGGKLSATLHLPANHPTNPFRHRRNGDHRTGFDITRLVKLSFVEPENEAQDAVIVGGARDVDRITGIYEEEIHGLHKALTGQGGAEVGLRTKGSFTLHRISHIDTLNAK